MIPSVWVHGQSYKHCHIRLLYHPPSEKAPFCSKVFYVPNACIRIQKLQELKRRSQKEIGKGYWASRKSKKQIFKQIQ